MNSADVTSTENMTFVIAAGGTGGHFYPALAIARACRQRGHRVLFAVGGQHAQEHEQLARENNFAAFTIDTPRLPRSPWQAISFLGSFARAWLGMRRKLKSIKPQALLGMGSFAAAPACAAAVSLRIPLALHEGNAVLGTANRLWARGSRAIALSLPIKTGLPAARCTCTEITGLPLRPALLQEAKRDKKTSKSQALKKYGLVDNKPVLLIFGGSQGAVYLNELMLNILPELGDSVHALQIIHLSGSQPATEKLQDAYDQHGIGAVVLSREAAIQDCYAAADLVLCRAGAATISELALFELPAILVPLPSAARDHQAKNAKLLETEKAASVLPQGPDAAATAARMLKKWLNTPRACDERRRNIRQFAHPDAANQVADLLERLPGKSDIE
ncbi:MAG: UDP-N-acetylglucosamine--N-acetylmuramyl-(pentapeptide) pyrophosphoryl-undecaprenol N-acetylglucosamine transferase [Lentisphaeria bacterium]